jgi:LytS/YehU family sensor histidine kinase
VAPPPDRGGPPPDFSPDTPPPLVFAGVALRKAYNGIPLYLLIAALAHAFFFWRNLRAREQRLSLVEERLLVARADMLRLQLEPHFLFNTLNAIGTLVYRDAALADDLIGRLSTLLRRLLDLRDERTISLDAEMETLRAYVGIEQARFGERLRYEESIDAAARAFPVPVMLLQPLAENAVRHGIEPLGRPGTLWVTAGVQEERLAVCIEDDGVGMGGASDSPHGFGLGLTNASVRLRAMYGTTASIASMARSGGGTRIEIRLPRAPLADAAAITISEELRA